jgi:hypothetical protein
MNKRQIIASLNNIANTLDNSGFNKEADTITEVMKKLAYYGQEQTDLNQDYSRQKEDFGNQGRNTVREIMGIIADKLRDNEEARKDFTGGRLQSWVFSILDILVRDGMNEAMAAINKDLKQYDVMIIQSELEFLFRSYLRNQGKL